HTACAVAGSTRCRRDRARGVHNERLRSCLGRRRFLLQLRHDRPVGYRLRPHRAQPSGRLVRALAEVRRRHDRRRTDHQVHDGAGMSSVGLLAPRGNVAVREEMAALLGTTVVLHDLELVADGSGTYAGSLTRRIAAYLADLPAVLSTA